MFHNQLEGGDLHAPSQTLVENNTGSAIPAMKAVTITGMGTTYPQIALGNGSAANIRGITVGNFPTGVASFIASFGVAFNLNTAAWTVELLCIRIIPAI